MHENSFEESAQKNVGEHGELTDTEPVSDPQATLGVIEPYSCCSHQEAVSQTFENDIPSVSVSGISLTLFSAHDYSGALRLEALKLNGHDVGTTGGTFNHDAADQAYTLSVAIAPAIDVTDDEIGVEVRVCQEGGGVVEGIMVIDVHYPF